MKIISILLVIGTFAVSTSFAGLSDLSGRAERMVKESSTDVKAMNALLEQMSVELTTTFNMSGRQSSGRTRALKSYRALKYHYDIIAGNYSQLGFVDLVNELRKVSSSKFKEDKAKKKNICQELEYKIINPGIYHGPGRTQALKIYDKECV